MRKIIPAQLERARMSRDQAGPWYRPPGSISGAFQLRGPALDLLTIISGEADRDVPFEHVSASLKNRTPTWEEMCFVKDLFWAEDECVIQYHPPKKDYVNCHPYALHLWKPIGVTIPLPPRDAV